MLDVRKFAQGRRFRPALGKTLAQSAAWRRLLIVLSLLLLKMLVLLLL